LPSDLYSGYAELKVPYSTNIKVWSKPEKANEWREKLPRKQPKEQ